MSFSRHSVSDAVHGRGIASELMSSAEFCVTARPIVDGPAFDTTPLPEHGTAVDDAARRRRPHQWRRNMQALVDGVKNGIVGTVKGAGEIVDAVADTVSKSLSNALKGTGNVGLALTEAVTDVSTGAIQGV